MYGLSTVPPLLVDFVFLTDLQNLKPGKDLSNGSRRRNSFAWTCLSSEFQKEQRGLGNSEGGTLGAVKPHEAGSEIISTIKSIPPLSSC